MARAIAFTRIEHDGEVYEPGDDVSDVFDEDKLKHLFEVGAVATYDRTKTPAENAAMVSELAASNEQLRLRVAELEAELSESDQPAESEARAKVSKVYEDQNERLGQKVTELEAQLAELQRKKAEQPEGEATEPKPNE